MVTIDRSEFANELRSLLLLTENGSFCRFDHVGSDIWFSFERLSGSDTSAVLALRIPKQDRTVSAAEALQNVYESQGFQFEWTEQENESLLARVEITVEDIWNEYSGVNGAHAARLLIDELGLGHDARFSFKTLGKGSRRALDSAEFEHRL